MVSTRKEQLAKKGDLPCGPAARHPLWPEARWNLTGLFGHDLLTLQVFSILRDKFRCHLAIDSIHGAPQVPWNCGRLMTTPVPTQAGVQSMVSTFNDVGVGVYFTFTNHLLTESDLDHPACNMLLESIDNGRGMNGVILSSDLLYDYIRRRHPELKLTASVVKVTEEEKRGDVAYYRLAQERFDSVMVHPDDGFVPEVLAELDRDKVEILVNEDCAYRCAHRIRDYQMMALVMRGEVAGGEELERTTVRKSYCRLPQARLVPDVRCCNFTTAEMIRVYEMGFRRFKLQGRQNMPATFLFDLLRFAVEPGLIAPIIFKALVSGQAARLAGEAVMKVRSSFRDGAEAGVAAADGEPCRTDSATIQPIVVEAPRVEGCRLPSGLEARHPCWPDASWTLEGLTENGYMFLDVMRLLVARFDYHLNIDSVCEELRVPWNGWPASKGSKLNVDAVADIVRHFNEANIGVSFAFHGADITSADLDDETGNGVLAALERGPSLNGVIVASDVLADHIRTQHPKLKLTASMVKTIRENGRGRAEHYKALAERFDVVSLCPEDGFNMDLLAQLDRDRTKILVNDNGAWGSVAENGHNSPSAPTEALAANVRLRNFTTAELKRVYDLGYRRFRLQSPSKIRDVFMYDVLRYILEPDLLLPVIFKSVTNAPELNKPRGP